MTLRFVVASGGKFHAFSLVSALDQQGALERFYTIYFSPQNRTLAHWIRRQDKEIINLDRVRTNILPETPPRLGGHLPGIRRYMDYVKAVWFDGWVAANLKHEQADVFMGWSNSSLISLRVAKRRGMRTVVTRGSSHICYQEAILGLEYAKRGLRFQLPYGIRERELAEYEISDYVRIPSSYVRRTFLQYGVPDRKLLQLSYTVDLAHFHPMARQDDTTFRVLFLNALTLQKGFYYAAQVVETLNSKRLPDIEFWFIGHSEALVERAFRELCERHANVRAHGFINHYELAAWISQCDVGVFPTIQEGLANTVPQTLACSVPVIATVNSGAEDLVDDGVEGFVVPIMDADALVDKILWCYKRRADCREMGRAAAARSSLRTWDQVAEELKQKLEHGSEN